MLGVAQTSTREWPPTARRTAGADATDTIVASRDGGVVSRLQRMEKRLETWVSGAFSRMFRSEVQPVEVASALQHELDRNAQVLSRERSLAPNAFTVRLSPRDHDRLAPYSTSLVAELTSLVTEHADLQRYAFPGPVEVHVERDEELRTGQLRVSSAVRAGVSSPARDLPHAAPAYLSVHDAVVPVTAAGVLVGRGSDADVRIDDPGVSRRHAEFRVLGEGSDADVVVVDLHSTNGTMVDGSRVAQAPVAEGTRVQVGSTTITVHRSDPRRQG